MLANSTSFSFWFIPSQSITAETIIKLLGGNDFNSLIPSELKSIFSAVELKSLGVGVDISKLTVLWISGGIGSSGPWHMGQFQIDDVTLRYTLVDPFGSKRSSFVFDASAQIFPTVFKGEFTVEINYSPASSALAVAANFLGTVTLSDLVSGLSGGKVSTEGLGFELTFEDFGMTFSSGTGGNYNYSLYGSAEASFDTPVLGAKPQAVFTAYVDSATSSYKLTGGLTLGNSFFQAELDLTKDTKVLTASWQALHEDYLGVADIITALGFTAPAIPKDLDLALEAASITYDFTNTIFVLKADSANYGKAVFAGRKSPAATGRGGGTPPVTGTELAVVGEDTDGGSQWQFFFGLAVDIPIVLTNLPLVKNIVSPDDVVDITGIQVVIASAKLDATAATEINNLITSSQVAGTAGDTVSYPKVPAEGMPQGIGLSMVFNAGSYHTPLTITFGSSSNNQQTGTTTLPAGTTVLALTAPGDTPPPSNTSSDGTVWYDLQKTFGPIAFQKVGIRYKDSVLYVLMNASLSAGGLTIAVLGLGLGSPLSSFKPTFNIDGVAIGFSEGPVKIAGGLLGTISPVNFVGALTIQVPEMSIYALGAYAEYEDHPSFFLYAAVNTPIGGPPYFFVHGLAAGFGFNRKLLIPDVSGVDTFPLVQWAMGNGSPSTDPNSDIGKQVSTVLTSLAKTGVVAPSVGDYWLAAGIMFTSLEIVNGFALLTVSFGTDFEVALLGLARATLPPSVAPNEPIVAQVELAIEASFTLSTGLLSIAGELTKNSFLLSPDCHLTGGFAFYVWLSGPHAGEFVITLGGYNPHFEVPDYYPKVPR
ncbi:MAG: hypothetical protein M3328_06230, partial [Chloroflexota bacterium]|nr:hypothetical protein [Chloroflexota bacterium]